MQNLITAKTSPFKLAENNKEFRFQLSHSSYRSTIKLLNRLLYVFSQDEAMLRMFIQ